MSPFIRVIYVIGRTTKGLGYVYSSFIKTKPPTSLSEATIQDHFPILFDISV